MNRAAEPSSLHTPSAGVAAVQPPWLDTPLGRRLIACEQDAVAGALEPVFGEELLQIGGWGTRELFLRYARTRASGVVDLPGAPGCDVAAALDALPLASDSVDAVLLPHTLEHVESPHELLREVHRVLRQNGWLLILGISSRGPFGWRRLFSGGRFPPQCRRLLPERRVLDWLQLLDYAVEGRSRMLYGWPAQRGFSEARQKALDAWCNRWLPGVLAGAYLVAARKRMAPVAVVSQPWKRRLRVVDGLAKPTTRNCA